MENHIIAVDGIERFVGRLAVEFAGAAEYIHFVGGAAYPHFFGEQVRTLLPIAQLADAPETRNVFGALASLGGAVKKVKKPR
jgi:hypothetical protein